jgi:hypothetical protein
MVKFNPGWGWDYKFGLLELLIKRGYSITPAAPCAEWTDLSESFLQDWTAGDSTKANY